MLKTAEVSPISTLYQHLTDLMFRAIMSKICSLQSTEESERPAITPSQANALHYASGYVCRHLCKKLKGSSHQFKEEFIQCLVKLVRDVDDNEEIETVEEWTELVHRGGLWRVRNTFQVFCALEEELQLSLHTVVLESTDATKATLIRKLTTNEDVTFYWCIAASDFTIEDEEAHAELLYMITELFITIRGFSFASAWVERYKRSQKKCTQHSKSLRKKCTLTITVKALMKLFVQYISLLLYF